MALTERRLRELRKEELHRVELRSEVPRRSTFVDLAEPNALRPWVAVAVAAAWTVLLPVAAAIQPPAAAPGGEPAWSVVYGAVSMVILAIAAVSLARRQRVGLVASATAAGLSLIAVITCPMSGHHAAVGAWWFVQMSGFAALGALSLAAMRLSRSHK